MLIRINKANASYEVITTYSECTAGKYDVLKTTPKKCQFIIPS